VGLSRVSYDSSKPLAERLADVALTVPDVGSLLGLLPQLKGARVSISERSTTTVEGALLGLDRAPSSSDRVNRETILVSLITDSGVLRSFHLLDVTRLQILDDGLRADLENFLQAQLNSKRRNAKSVDVLSQGEGARRVRLAYCVAAPVWKATYRILLEEGDHSPMLQGWAVVDNTQDEDWVNVDLSLVSGLPISFVHDFYCPGTSNGRRWKPPRQQAWRR
jgi:hypothetical protein